MDVHKDDSIFDVPYPSDGDSFITGSRAYGTPSLDSDLDLVVKISRYDLGKLVEFCRIRNLDPDGNLPDIEYLTGRSSTANLRFDGLNLIVTTDDRDYQVWLEGTRELIERRPVTRDEAVATFKARQDKSRESA